MEEEEEEQPFHTIVSKKTNDEIPSIVNSILEEQFDNDHKSDSNELDDHIIMHGDNRQCLCIKETGKSY